MKKEFFDIGYDFKTKEKYIIIESYVSADPSIIKVSIINDNEYKIIEGCTRLIDTEKILIALDKEYENLILDIGHGASFIIDIINTNNLSYSIRVPTRAQYRDMNTNRWTLIGLYIYERHLVQNDNLT